MAYIESAFYGDEKSQRDATKVLGDKVVGTTLDTVVDEGLIPPFTQTTSATVTNAEEKKIRDDAVRACGGADQKCIDDTMARLRQEKLNEKMNQARSSATTIKGRRLTVNLIDENGKRQRIVVPDGQQFKLDNISVTDPKKGPLQLPSYEYFQSQLKLIGTLILSTLIYVFSVAATYTLFMQNAEILAIPATAVAVFIPYSGYVMIFLYFMFNSAIKTYIGEKQ